MSQDNGFFTNLDANMQDRPRTRDYASKSWLRLEIRGRIDEAKRDVDRVIFWAIVAMYSIAKAWGIV